MNKKIKKQYETFNRYILAEFMTEKELKEIDKQYTEAKIERLIRKIRTNVRLR